MGKTITTFDQIPLPLTTNKYVWFSLAIIFGILCALLMTLFYFQELFVVVLFGLCFIALFNKAAKIFGKLTEKYTPRQRRVFEIAVTLIFGTFLFYFCAVQISNLSEILLDLSGLQEMIVQGTQFLMTLLSVFPDSVTVWIENVVNDLINSISQQIGALISQAFFYILAIILLYPIMFKMYLRDSSSINKKLNDLIPLRFETEIKNTASAVMTQSNNFLVAKIIESVGISIICCVGFYLIGLPGWFFLGVLAGLLNNVPYIGPIFATVPPVIIGLAIGWELAVFAATVCFIAQLVDNLYLVPFMISNKVSVNPFTTVLLILTFSELYGALGMILSIPIYIVCKIILIESYKLLIRVFPEPVDS